MKENQAIHLHLLDAVTFVLEASEVTLFPHRPPDTGGDDLPSFIMTRNVGKATPYHQGLDNLGMAQSRPFESMKMLQKILVILL